MALLKYQVQTQLDYLKRANAETNPQDTYWVDEASGRTSLNKPSETKLQESLDWIQEQKAKYPESYANLKTELFDPFEEALRQYAVKNKLAIAATIAQAKTDGENLKCEVNQNADNVPKKNAEVGSIEARYNERTMKGFKKRIAAVSAKLDSGDTKLKELGEVLNKVLQNSDGINVIELQQKMKEIQKVRVSSRGEEGDADGFFGPLTMAGLEKIAGIEVATTGVKTAHEGNKAEKPAAKAQADAAASDNADVAKTDGSSATKGATGSSADKPAERAKRETPSHAFVLKDGTEVVGMYVHEGRTWIIGKKGERKVLDSSLMPFDKKQSLEVTATLENAKRLAPMVDDGFMLLQAIANHAEAKNWKAKKSWGERLGAYKAFVEDLDVSDLAAARKKIVAFVTATSNPSSDLAKELNDAFNIVDSDVERRKHVYEYISGDWMLTAKHSGFDGGSEVISQKIAAGELAKKGIGHEQLKAFVDQWMNANWEGYSDKQVAEAIKQSAKNAKGVYAFLVANYGEKDLADFVSDFRDASKKLKEAYDDPKIEGELAKSIGDKSKREQYKLESRKEKLVSILGINSLTQYASAHRDELKSNSELKIFADIQGVGGLSVKTQKYIRNELWKDVTFELAALTAGAVTAGWGTAALNMAMASRWGMRGIELARLGNRAADIASHAEYIVFKPGVNFVARTVAGGAGFELGHGGVRTAAASYEHGEFTNQWSVAGFMQSMAFAGAFEAVGMAMRKAGVAAFSKEIPLSEQKALLAKYVAADSLVSLGVSYGIAKWQGENFTWEEAMQAIAMAALFRTAMTKAEGMKFRVRREPNESIKLEPTVQEGGDTHASQASKLASVSTEAEANRTSPQELIDSELEKLKKSLEKLKETRATNLQMLKDAETIRTAYEDMKNALEALKEAKLSGKHTFTWTTNTGYEINENIRSRANFEKVRSMIEQRKAEAVHEITRLAQKALDRAVSAMSHENVQPTETAAAEQGPETQQTEQQSSPAESGVLTQNLTQRLSENLEQILQKLKKGKGAYRVGDAEVHRESNGRFKLVSEEGTFLYPDAQEAANALARKMSLEARMKFFMESEEKSFALKRKEYFGKDKERLLPNGNFKIVTNSKGEPEYYRKENGEFKKTETLTPEEMIAVQEGILGAEPGIFAKALKRSPKLKETPIDGTISDAEKKGYIAKYGQKAYDAMVAKANQMRNALVSGAVDSGKSAFGAVKALGWDFPKWLIFGGSHAWGKDGWKIAFGWALLNEWLEYQKDPHGYHNRTLTEGAISLGANFLFIKWIGLVRATGLNLITPDIIPSRVGEYYEKGKEKAADAYEKVKEAI